MRRILTFVIGVCMLGSGLGLMDISGSHSKSTAILTIDDFPDLSAYKVAVFQESSSEHVDYMTTSYPIPSNVRNDEYPLGSIIWQYQISGGSDNSPKAIGSLGDINDDWIDDVVVCSEDNLIRCFSGGAIGTGDVLWDHEIYAGNIYSQNGLAMIEDVNGDGYADVVVGATGGARLIRCISGENGEVLWTHDTHEYGDGGWVYQVDCRYDYNDDGLVDVLAVTGDDSSDTGPKRVYCLDGYTGESIWERPLGGPGFAVMGVEDFTGDGVPDVLAGCSNEGETTGYAKGINGATGAQEWSFTSAGSSVWGVEQIDDVNGDGIQDVIIGDFSGHIYGLNAETGGQLFTCSIGSAIITRLERLSDVNSDGHPDIIPAHSSVDTTQVIDGFTGDIIWSHPVADQPWNVAPIADITGDDIEDVLVGTLYTSNYCYFLNGVDGSELKSIAYGEAVDAIASIPDVIGDGSMEMMAGGREGKVTCYSGGVVITPQVNLTAEFSATPLSGAAPLQVQFTDLSVAENTTITQWRWDFDNDGTPDAYTANASFFYTEPGNYTVSLTVSDGTLFDTETKEHYITVLSGGNALEIGAITGGMLKISAEILNNGTTVVTSVNWSMTITGGLVVLGKTTSDTITSIAAGGTEIIIDRPVFGLGRITITVTVEIPDSTPVTKTATGFLFFFLVLGVT